MSARDELLEWAGLALRGGATSAWLKRLEAKLDAAITEAVVQERETLAAIEEWTHRYGAELKPTGADTYGEGVRASKDAVARLLRRRMTGGER